MNRPAHPNPSMPTSSLARNRPPAGTRWKGRRRAVIGWILAGMGALSVIGGLMGQVSPEGKSPLPGGIIFIAMGAGLIWWGRRLKARGLTRPTPAARAAALQESEKAKAARREAEREEHRARVAAERERIRAEAEQYERERLEREAREAEQRTQHEFQQHAQQEREARARKHAEEKQAKVARRQARRREREVRRAEKLERRRIAEERNRRELRKTQERMARLKAQEEEEKAHHGYMDGEDWIPPKPGNSFLRPWARGHGLEVVGEYYRPEAFRRLTCRQPEFRAYEGSELHTDAVLVPDPRNPYGCGTAISVWVGGEHVGYLAQKDADQYFPVLASRAEKGQFLQVPARTWVSLVNGGVNARVTLTIPEPSGIVPSNDLPQVPHIVLPSGKRIQVTKEDEHMDVLSDYVLRGSGRVNHVAATLLSINEIRPRSSYEAVQVKIDGQSVGVLTKGQSDKLLPLVKHIEEHGLLPVVRAQVTGTRLKAEVVLDTVTAETVDDDWIDSLGPATGTANVDQMPEAASRPDFEWDDD